MASRLAGPHRAADPAEESENHYLAGMTIPLPRTLSCLAGSALLGLAACHEASPPAAAVPPARPTPASAPPLVAHQLGTTGLTIRLPATYRLHLTEGADFQVYNFAAADITAAELFTGGLYVGGYPAPFDSLAGCRRHPRQLVLGRPARWLLSQCATGHTLEVQAALPADPAYSLQLHLFGQARSAAGLRQLLAVVATLQYQPPRMPAAH